MKKLLVILSILAGTQASAGILLEPYVGQHFGGTTQNGASDNDVSGLGYGARVGWTLPLVFFAFDYSTATLDVEPSSGGGGEIDADYSAMGVVAGVSLPVIRLWAGYNFAAEYDVDQVAKYEGNGMKAGIGFKMPLLPISFNLEYIMNEYDEASGISLGNSPVEHKSLFLSVSAPFNL